MTVGTPAFRTYGSRIFLGTLVLCLITWVSLGSLAHGQTPPPPRAYLLKAGFIYNFTKFIQWPDEIRSTSADHRFHICLVGQDPFGAIMDQLAATREVWGQSIKVRRNPLPSEFSGCQIIYFSPSEKNRLKTLLQPIEGKPILAIGDTPGFAAMGGGINLVIQGNRIRFEINRSALERSGLKPSSELLDLAIIVQPETDP